MITAVKAVFALLGFFFLLSLAVIIVRALPYLLGAGAIVWILVLVARKVFGQQQSEFRREEAKSDPASGSGSPSPSEEKQRQQRERDNARREKDRERERSSHQGQSVFEGTYYEALGVTPAASIEEIEDAWRKLDYGQPLPIELRRTYFEAYRVLSDPSERLKYDATLKRQQRQRGSQERKGQEERHAREQAGWRHRREDREQERRRQQKLGHSEKRQRRRNSRKQARSTRPEDYYSRLGVKHDATPKEIKTAFRTLAQRWHPDVCKRPDATALFQMVSEAYNVLSLPEERRKYDAKLRQAPRQPEKRQRESGYAGAAQNQSRSGHWRESHSARQQERGRAEKSEEQDRGRRNWSNSGRLFTGTWTKIRRGPLAGTWGVWIDSLYVMEGERALIARRDGHQSLVVIIQVLRRSQGNRVTLCRVRII